MASQTDRDKKTARRSPNRRRANDAQEETTRSARAEANGQPVEVPDHVRFDTSVRTYQSDQFTHGDLGLDEEQLLAMYRNMLLQRRFEERAAQMYGKQKIAGFLHLYIGQEAVSTGAAHALSVGKDSVITAYRDHGIGLALGMGPNECMAELFGKVTGSSRGKGGSMHYFDREKGMFGGHGIVGAHIPVGTGIAFAHKYREDGGVCLCFFGDGAVGQGSFHEAANLAALFELPLVLVIENNQYAMGTAVHRAFAEPEFYKQAVGYGLPASIVNGMDLLTVTKAFRDHVEMAREFQPSLMEVRTYRYRGHSMSDPAKYRTKEELERKKDEDPIIRLKKYLMDNKIADNEPLDRVDDEVKQEVIDAVEFAENSDFPPIESIYEDVYVEDDYPFLTD